MTHLGSSVGDSVPLERVIHELCKFKEGEGEGERKKRDFDIYISHGEKHHCLSNLREREKERQREKTEVLFMQINRES